MTRNDDSIRELTSRLGALDGDEKETCPHTEGIFDAARGDSTPDRIRQLIDHSIECPSCADAWFVARELSDGDIERTNEWAGVVDGQESARKSSWALVGGLAAAALFAVTVGFQIAREETGSQDGYLVADTQSVRGGGDVEETRIAFETAAGTVLPRDACEVHWRGPEGARYKVEVSLIGDFATIAESGSNYKNTSFLVDPSQLDGLAAGKELRWGVSVWDEDTNRWAGRVELSVFC